MVKRLIVICLVFLLGCKKEEECKGPLVDTILPSSDTPSHWLEMIKPKSTLFFNSSYGRSISFDLDPRFRNTSFGFENCSPLLGEERFLSYNSSLYGYSFNILIYRHWEIDKFLVCELYQKSYFNPQNRLEINLNDTINKLAHFLGSKSYKPYDLIQPYQKLYSLKIGLKEYDKVFKIDVKDKLYSIDNNQIKVYYIDSKFGLVMFETFEGETWTITP